MQKSLTILIEGAIEDVIKEEQGYYIGNLSILNKKNLDSLRNSFIQHAEKYFGKKGKIAEDGNYQVTYKEKRSFTNDEYITPIALTTIIPLSRKTIQWYVQYYCNPYAFTGRNLLLLSELSDIKIIQSIPKYISFENACSLLQVESTEEKISFANIAFQKKFNSEEIKIDSEKVFSEENLWDVKRDFLFEILSYFYEKLPHKFSENNREREKRKDDTLERMYKNERDKTDVEKILDAINRGYGYRCAIMRQTYLPARRIDTLVNEYDLEKHTVFWSKVIRLKNAIDEQNTQDCIEQITELSSEEINRIFLLKQKIQKDVKKGKSIKHLISSFSKRYSKISEKQALLLADNSWMNIYEPIYSPCRPEIDTFIEQGYSAFKIGKILKTQGKFLSRQAICNYIHKTGQTSFLKKKIDEHKTDRHRKSERLKNARSLFLSCLEQKVVEQAATPALQATVCYINQTNKNTENIPSEKILFVFETYFSELKNKEYLSYSSIAKKTKMCVPSVRRILKKVGLHSSYDSFSDKLADETLSAIFNAKETKLRNADISYFTQTSNATVLNKLGSRKNAFLFGCGILKSILTYRVASQIYEAKDAHFTKKEIGELVEKPTDTIEYALRNREKIEEELISFLQKMYPERNITTPYMVKENKIEYKKS